MNGLVIIVELLSLCLAKDELQLYYIKFIHITLYYIIILYYIISYYITSYIYLLLIYNLHKGRNNKVKLEKSIRQLWQLENSWRKAYDRG